ncbi:MAG: SGNH/GDSL hydrolase family protein [Atribacterota bacterium]|jgi:lysophospholipase L1-like esterase|nr:SGNH/GDSL hydrolase family protein [Atribacterota bacterium]
MIACFGDSITAGIPGISYLRYLESKKKHLNFGVGGDTLLGLSKRIDKFLANSSCDEIIIQIGTNDILLPFLKQRSRAWEKIIYRLNIRGSLPIIDVETFIEKYEILINKILDFKIKVISIPCIGENIESELNKKVDIYNVAINNLCKKYNIIYIDFNKWQKGIIRQSDIESEYIISEHFIKIIFDTILTTYLGFSKHISKKRKLVVTIDGVHLNKIGAKGLAELITTEQLNGH